jgi:type IV pilus assembly protein PilQ
MAFIGEERTVKQAQALSGIVVGGAVSLLATQPVWAAATQVTGVDLNQGDQQLELILETKSGEENPQISTVKRGNDLVADITNARLALQEGESFRQENPLPGIREILVSQLDNNKVQIIVSGAHRAPTGEIKHQDTKRISFNLSSENKTESQTKDSREALSARAKTAEQIPPSPLLKEKTPSTETSSSLKQTAKVDKETQLAQATSVPTKPKVQAQTPAPVPLVPPTSPAAPVQPAPAPGQNGQPAPAPDQVTPSTPQAPAPGQVIPSPRPDVLVPNPKITIEGTPAPAAGAAQPVAPAPPFLPRAVAPPLGDVAVSNINASASFIDLGTAARVPRLVLREAPVREVLSLLARAAGLNVAFTGEGGAGGTPGAPPAGAQKTISLDLENESVQNAFNYVLQVSGLQANRVGNTILVGAQLPDTARNIISRTLRLNQVSALQATNFLISQGAEQQQVVTQTTLTVVGEGAAAQRITNTTTSVQRVTPPLEQQQAAPGANPPQAGPQILRGLSVTPDIRLNAVTVIGEPRKIEIATALLSQLDLRRRQVAVNVKVVDVNLQGVDGFSNSFSFGIGNFLFGSDAGQANISYNGANPPRSNQKKLIAALQAQIVSNNAKILTDPTLVVQEGQNAKINLTQEVVGNIKSDTQSTNGQTTKTVTAEIREAGLILEIAVERIDDNGFIGLTVNPRVTSIGSTQNLSVDQDVNTIALLNVRQLTSGLVRLRDSQTLILSGIIQQSDRSTVRKVPILGDIPILGALFRRTERENQRNEIIVLVTPQIIQDAAGSSFGYNYTPGQETRQLLQRQGVNP